MKLSALLLLLITGGKPEPIEIRESQGHGAKTEIAKSSNKKAKLMTMDEVFTMTNPFDA